MKTLILFMTLFLTGCLVDGKGNAVSAPTDAVGGLDGEWINTSTGNGYPFCTEFGGSWVCQMTTGPQPAACDSVPLMDGVIIIAVGFTITGDVVRIGGLTPKTFSVLSGQAGEFEGVQVETTGPNEMVVTYATGCSIQFQRTMP